MTFRGEALNGNLHEHFSAMRLMRRIAESVTRPTIWSLPHSSTIELTIMRRIASLSLFAAVALAACGDDDPAGTLTADYTLHPAAASYSVGQDSTVDLAVKVLRNATDTVKDVRLVYTSDNVNIARVSGTGIVTGLSGGTANITVQGQETSVTLPVTVRPWPATTVQLSVLSGPASAGIIGTRLSTNLDTGTFYGLPAHAASSRLKALVLRGTDTVYCNYCAPKTPPRVFRLVNFRSLNDSLATVSNASDPTVQGQTTTDAGVDLAGWVTVRDTSSTGVKIVLEVPGDNLADTVTLKLKLRPIDKLRVRPDSTFVPTTNGTGLQKTIWPGHTVNDTIQANAIQNTVTNFSVGVTFIALAQTLPRANTTTSPTASSLTVPISITPVGGVTSRRTNLPAVTWETANPNFLTINAAGVIVAPCANIGLTCNTESQTARNAMVLTCADVAGKIPQTVFAGEGTYTIPSCNPVRTITPMPGAVCTTANDTDPTSTCSIWIRASATDQATGNLLTRLYRINVRR